MSGSEQCRERQDFFHCRKGQISDRHQKVAPERILLISYTNKAAAELTERMGIPGLRGYTFHKLAIDLIGQYTGCKPSICDNTDALFIQVYRDLLNDVAFRKHAIEYFVDYQAQDADWERKSRNVANS